MPRTYTENRKMQNKKWDDANLDRMSLALPKGTKDRIKAVADADGESVNGWIRALIERELAKNAE